MAEGTRGPGRDDVSMVSGLSGSLLTGAPFVSGGHCQFEQEASKLASSRGFVLVHRRQSTRI